jgi:hypothetical protein
MNTLKSIPLTSLIMIFAVAIIVWFVVHFIMSTRRFGSVYEQKTSEGFFGGAAVGTGTPDCLRTLPEGSQILEALSSKKIGTEEGPPDFKELQLILSKLACLKKDLLSPSGIVEATRYQPYGTSHDREPIAELAGKCLQRTVPIRDLDITFKGYLERANILLRRLCTAAHLKENEVVRLEKLMKTAWSDVYDIAKGRCIATIPDAKFNPRDARPYEPKELSELREYDGYF